MRQVVIVGGGVAGLSIATKLGRRVGRSRDAEVTLIDRSFAHVWKPMLHTFASGTANSYQQRIPFLSHGARCGFRFPPGTLKSINLDVKHLCVGGIALPDGEVILANRDFPYEELILAAGSKANDFATRGSSTIACSLTISRRPNALMNSFTLNYCGRRRATSLFRSPLLAAERPAFNRLKDFRRIATRYDRLAINFHAAVCVAATVSYWL